MIELIKYFPKVIATPKRRICYTQQEFVAKFKEINGKYDKVYYGLYNLGKNGENTNYPYIHLTAFDIDNEETKYENTCKIHKILKDMNLKHSIVFSTKGFWVYVMNKNYENLIYPKDALYNAHEWFAEQFNMSWGNSKDSDLDKAIQGDINRIARLVGSYDINRERYCYSLTSDDLKKGMEHIIEKSKTHQSIKMNWYGEEHFDIKTMDRVMKKMGYIGGNQQDYSGVSVPSITYEFNNRNIPKFINSFLPIVKEWLTNPEGTDWKQRFWTSVYMENIGLPIEIAEKISRYFYIKQPRTDYLRNNYKKFVVTKQLKEAYQKQLNFPRIEKLLIDGLIEGASREDYEIFNKQIRKCYDIEKLFEEPKIKNEVVEPIKT